MAIYTDNYGVTKVGDVPNFSKGDGTKPGDLASGHAARGAGGLPGVNGGVGQTQPDFTVKPGTFPNPVNFDPNNPTGAPDMGELLKYLGIGAGVAGGAYGAYKLLGPKLADFLTPDMEDFTSGRGSTRWTNVPAGDAPAMGATADPKVTPVRDIPDKYLAAPGNVTDAEFTVVKPGSNQVAGPAGQARLTYMPKGDLDTPQKAKAAPPPNPRAGKYFTDPAGQDLSNTRVPNAPHVFNDPAGQGTIVRNQPVVGGRIFADPAGQDTGKAAQEALRAAKLQGILRSLRMIIR